MDRTLVRVALLTVVALLASPTLVRGQGASVYTHGACMTARVGAGVADPCADGSAVFYNPAALSLQGGGAMLGASAIDAHARFIFDNTGERFDMTQPIEIAPHFFASYRPGPRVALGFGAWAPYGLGTRWPLDFEGRFVGYDNRLRALYLQPTAAYQVVPGRIAIGAGIAFLRTDIEIDERLDLAATPVPAVLSARLSVPPVAARSPTFGDLGVPAGTDFADAHLAVDAWATTYHLGVWASILQDLSIGARYLHSAKLELDGDARFRQVPTGLVLPPGNPLGLPAGTPLDLLLEPFFAAGGPLFRQRLTTEISLPGQLVVGLRYRFDPAVDVLFDYQWIGWSDFDRAVLDLFSAPNDTLFLGWRDTNTWRLGADYRLRPGLALRGGIAYNTAATPDNGVTPLLPEAHRFTFTAGAGYRFAGRLRVDGALEYAAQADRRGRVRPIDRPNIPAAQVNVGEYGGHVLLAALTLTYRLRRREPATTTSHEP